MFSCNECGKRIKTRQGLRDHHRDKHGVTSRVAGMTKEGALAVMADMGDLPDGAFLAMAAELGLDADDFIE